MVCVCVCVFGLWIESDRMRALRRRLDRVGGEFMDVKGRGFIIVSIVFGWFEPNCNCVYLVINVQS